MKKEIQLIALSYMTAWTLTLSFIYFYTMLSGETTATLTFNDYHEAIIEFPMFIIGTIATTIYIIKEVFISPKTYK